MIKTQNGLGRPAATNQFSFAIALAELLTGHRPNRLKP